MTEHYACGTLYRVDRGIAFVFIVGTAILGFLVGRGYQMAARAWKDYKTTKDSVPVLLRAFWAIVRGGLAIGLIAALWFGSSMYWSLTGGPEAKPTHKPTPTPAPASAPR